MNLSDNIKNEIITKITRNFNVSKIILFGSYANGTKHKDSDIDLLIILNENGFSKTYSEMINKRMRVRKLFYNIMRKIPMDILVYTKDEWKKLQESNHSFIQEINSTGVQLV